MKVIIRITSKQRHMMWKLKISINLNTKFSEDYMSKSYIQETQDAINVNVYIIKFLKPNLVPFIKETYKQDY